MAQAASRERDAERSRERDGLDRIERVRQIAEALSEEQRGRDRVVLLGIHPMAAGPADIPGQTHRGERLVRVALEEDVLDGDLEVVEAGDGLPAVRVERPPGATEAKSE